MGIILSSLTIPDHVMIINVFPWMSAVDTYHFQCVSRKTHALMQQAARTLLQDLSLSLSNENLPNFLSITQLHTHQGNITNFLLQKIKMSILKNFPLLSEKLEASYRPGYPISQFSPYPTPMPGLPPPNLPSDGQDTTNLLNHIILIRAFDLTLPILALDLTLNRFSKYDLSRIALALLKTVPADPIIFSDAQKCLTTILMHPKLQNTQIKIKHSLANLLRQTHPYTEHQIYRIKTMLVMLALPVPKFSSFFQEVYNILNEAIQKDDRSFVNWFLSDELMKSCLSQCGHHQDRLFLAALSQANLAYKLEIMKKILLHLHNEVIGLNTIDLTPYLDLLMQSQESEFVRTVFPYHLSTRASEQRKHHPKSRVCSIQ